MRFSVIIPTYNRSYQLMLTLTAFEKQTYPLDQFEVIVVNDGSVDNTLERLNQYQAQAPYRLLFTSLSHTSGRSMARNVGVAAAKEDYIIFCDPDFLVTPDFISVHAKYHEEKPLIASGIPNMWRNVYTQIHADFSEQEKVAAAHILKPSGLWSEHYFNTTDTIDLVTQDHVRNQTIPLDSIIMPWDIDDVGKVQYCSTDVSPWLLSVTRNMSLPKKVFLQVGGFNDKFQKYGLEDWELGYRLHRTGYNFVSIQEIIGYHQQHPQSYRNSDWPDENLKFVYESHGFEDPELSILSICAPWDSIILYKNALRIIKSWQKSKHSVYRNASKKLRHACTRSAELYYEDRHSPAYQHGLTVLKEAFIAMNELFVQDQSEHNQQEMVRIASHACNKLNMSKAPKVSKVRKVHKIRKVHKFRGIRKLRKIRKTRKLHNV
ncbi:glycosyltransferase family 2 protein [Paenibacillus sp. GCM10027629]|uniref:glycosyltransferase family 2 protein n=1 Tax=Paenibacillus sp. GCM10027629 TaxID=3273414 RepID=UPI003630939A